jgi:hypothetical protein
LAGVVTFTAGSGVVAGTSVAPVVDTIGPLPDIDVHVALAYYPEGTTIGRWDHAKWDTLGVWAGSPQLQDISCQVISTTISRGRDAPLERFRPSSCTVVIDDPDGLYSPWRTVGDPAPYSTVGPGIGLIVWASSGSLSWPRFAGIVDTINDDFPEHGLRHEVTFHAFDYMSVLAAFDGLEQTPVGAGETAGARLARVATNAAYTYPTQFDAGTVALQDTTLAKNALDEMGMVTDTELGGLFCTRDGTLRFYDRNGLVTEPAFTDVQAVFGDDCSTGVELPYTDVTLATNLDKIKNQVSISNVGGTAVTVQDLTSVGLYGKRTWQRMDLIHQNPTESTTIANAHLARYAYAANEIDGLAVELTVTSPAQQRLLLTLDLLWLIEVRRRAHGFQVVAELQIQAVGETITATSWTLTLNTFSAGDVFAAGRWDVAVWDTGKWGY